jgi:hypothetical protein
VVVEVVDFVEINTMVVNYMVTIVDSTAEGNKLVEHYKFEVKAYLVHQIIIVQ